MQYLNLLANTQVVSETLKADLSPLISGFVKVTIVIAILFVIFAGYNYITSRGNLKKLEHAKLTLRNTVLGLVIILSAGTFFSIIQNAYSSKSISPMDIKVQESNIENPDNIADIVNESIKTFLQGIIKSVGQPIVNTLKKLTTATPLMAQNTSVLNLWIIVIAMSNTLFLLVCILIGFRVMSSSTFGFTEIELHSIIPQIIFTFLMSNISIFIIDAIITVSNAMIHALMAGTSNQVVWTTLESLITGISSVNIGVLLFIVVVFILAVWLLIYYIKRLIILYIGAVLSPLIILLWLLPSFRDFSQSAAKVYISTIFTLFVQVVIILLSASLFSEFINSNNPFITTLLAIAMLSLLLSTNRTINHLSILNSGTQAIRKLGNTFTHGISYIISSAKTSSRLNPQTNNSTASIFSQRDINTSPLRIDSRTRQVSLHEASAALTDRERRGDVIVSGGATKPKVNLTETQSNEIHKNEKVKTK